MNIAIIGAGAAGLSAAYDLAGLGQQVTVYEAAPSTGGLAAGFKEPHWDWSMEKFYHHWFQSDRDVLGLIDEIGARDKVLFPRPVTAIYYHGQFHPLDSMFTNMPLFLLRHFPLADVASFGSAGAYLKFSSNWKALEQVTADEWLRRGAGRRLHAGHRAPDLERLQHLRAHPGDRQKFDTWSFAEDRDGLMRDLTNAPVKKQVLIKDATHFALFEQKRFEFFDEIHRFLKQ